MLPVGITALPATTSSGGASPASVTLHVDGGGGGGLSGFDRPSAEVGKWVFCPTWPFLFISIFLTPLFSHKS
jgi:hypothetical protein